MAANQYIVLKKDKKKHNGWEKWPEDLEMP
jgi:hypothetical protein